MSTIQTIEKIIKQVRTYKDALAFTYVKADSKEYDQFVESRLVGESIGNKTNIVGRGNFWAQTKVKLDTHVHGIDIMHSRIMLRAFMLTPTEVYVNGNLVFKEDYWADFNLPEVIICDDYQGESIDIVIHLESRNDVQATGDAFEVTLFIEKIDDILYDLETFLDELRFISGFDELKEVYASIVALLEQNVTDKSSVLDLQNMAHTERKKIEPYRHITKAYTCHLVGHAHIDMNWLWPMEETERIIGRDFDTVTKLLDRFPDLYFSQSQAAVYDITKQRYPEVYERIKKHAKRGHWDAMASTWVEGDLNMAQGETIARHLAYSKKFMQVEFGVKTRICWEPDTFGHPASTPQILKKSDIDYYYHYRCSDGHPLYAWEGNDGSRLLAFSSIYLNPITSHEVEKIATWVKKKYGTKHSLFVYGVGDHGGGPTIRDIKRAQFLDTCPGMPRVKFSTPEAFFDSVDKAEDLHVTKGEMNIVFDGCYTSQSEIKKHNRDLENVLNQLEKTSYLCTLLGRKVNDDAIFEMYKDLMFNQFHDILCGCSIKESYDYSNPILERHVGSAKAMVDRNIAMMTEQISSNENTIVVWNFEGYQRDDIACYAVDKQCKVLDDQGQEVLSSYHDGHVYFKAEGVPSFGCRMYELAPMSKETKNTWPVKRDTRTYQIKSDIYDLEIDSECGAIVRLYDKENDYAFVEKRDWRDVLFDYHNNVFSIEYEKPHNMSAWVIGPITRKEYLLSNAQVDVLHDDDFMKIISITHRVLNSTIREEIYIYKHFRRIDMKICVDWREVGSMDADFPMLKLCFAPTLTGNAKAFYHIPFSSIERPRDHIEYPALKWVDVNDGMHGYGIFNDSKYGYSKEGNKINITCIRSSYAPHPTPDLGEHRFGISLMPHRGGIQEANVNQHAQSMGNPLVVKQGKGNDDGKQTQVSFCSIDDDTIMVSTIKKCLYDDSMIIRLYQPYDRESYFTLYFAKEIQEVQEVTIPEDRMIRSIEVKENSFSDDLNAYEIKTYKVTFQ